MLKETTIFDSEDRLDHPRRSLLLTQQLALATLRRDIVRQHLRFERKRLERDPVATQLRDLISGKTHTHELEFLLARAPRSNVDCRTCKRKAATPNVAGCRFEITSATQRRDEFLARQFLTRSQHARRRVESGPAGQITTRQPRVYDLRIVT